MAFLRAIATLKENTIKLLKSDNGNNRSIDSIISYHRRTGNFLPGGGGGVNHLPKKISQVAQIFTKESEREEGRITTTYAVLAYEDGLIQLVFRVNTKFEYKLCRHKRAFGKIATTVVLR